MADLSDAQAASAALGELHSSVHTCCRIAVALIGTGETWSQDFLGCLFPTEYERAKKATMKRCKAVAPQLLKIRKAVLSADAIWATNTVASVLQCCQQCPSTNKQRLSEGKPFRCEARGKLDSRARKGFRFRLDKKGQIHELS